MTFSISSSPVKTDQEIEYMRKSGEILANVLAETRKIIQPGITTKEIDQYAEKLIAKHNVQPSFKGYHDYPAVSCISVNEEVVHCIPGSRKLNPGDIISLDCGVIYQGFHSDACIVIGLEPLSPEVKKIIKTAQKALQLGIEKALPGNHIGDISSIIQHTIEKEGYTVAKEFTGHGIGRNLHEKPAVPNIGRKGSGPALIPGMTLAIEPIFYQGKSGINFLDDNWSTSTKDGHLAIQVEHTILITPTGPEILTMEKQ